MRQKLTNEELRSCPVEITGTVTVANPSGGEGGGLTDTQLRASAVPVSISGTVPVSGTFYPATQPVSGTFWQATQPVSIASMPTTPVTGTFWQATQPVSGTVSVSGSVAVTGTFYQATQPVSIASMPSTPVTGTFWQATQPVSVAATVATRDLKDNARVLKIFSATFTAATTEGMVTLTPVADGASGATGTSFGVTSGKKLRLQSLSVSTKNAGAAGQGVVCNLRVSSTGAVTTSTPIAATCGAGTYLAIANVAGGNTILIPDGLELSGNMQLGISQIGTATAGNTVTLIGYEY